MTHDLFAPARVTIGDATIINGNCLTVMRSMPPASIDSVVTDPPYHLSSITKRLGSADASPIQFGTDGAYARAAAGFMGKKWDGGDIAFQVETWREVFRVLKPGGHLVAFGGTRSSHRMVTAIEDAGFEIRDRIRYECDGTDKYGPLLDSLNEAQRGAVLELLHEASGGSELAWVYGSGFPKSHNVGKGIDDLLGAARPVISQGKAEKRMIPGARQNKQGWEKNDGREFVPTLTGPATPQAAAWEGWGTALKPAHEPICLARKPLIGSVAVNVLEHGTGAINIDASRIGRGPDISITIGDRLFVQINSRYPANFIHDGSPVFPETTSGNLNKVNGSGTGYGFKGQKDIGHVGDTGSAGRFFYQAKANKADRAGSRHPTVKPISLIEYLVMMITPPGGIVMDCFAGSGTTLEAARRCGFRSIGIEREVEYVLDIKRRLSR